MACYDSKKCEKEFPIYHDEKWKKQSRKYSRNLLSTRYQTQVRVLRGKKRKLKMRIERIQKEQGANGWGRAGQGRNIQMNSIQSAAVRKYEMKCCRWGEFAIQSPATRNIVKKCIRGQFLLFLALLAVLAVALLWPKRSWGWSYCCGCHWCLNTKCLMAKLPQNVSQTRGSHRSKNEMRFWLLKSFWCLCVSGCLLERKQPGYQYQYASFVALRLPRQPPVPAPSNNCSPPEVDILASGSVAASWDKGVTSPKNSYFPFRFPPFSPCINFHLTDVLPSTKKKKTRSIWKSFVAIWPRHSTDAGIKAN